MNKQDFLSMQSTSAMVDPLPKLVVVVGPTGVGKSKISLGLACEFNGEIVNGDATAMYRHLDIGSAKPTLRERSKIPHHLIDVASPDENLTVAQYQQLAYKAIDDILSRGKQPFLVGGSGLYVRVVIEGYKIPSVPPDHELRQILARETAMRGYAWLQDMLRNLDPMAATRINPTNTRRVIRAIEVCKATEQPISILWKRREVRYSPIVIGLIRPIEELFARINLRVDLMLREGLVDEVKSILDMGYMPESPALLAIGYKEVIAYLRGDIDLESAAHQIKQATRRLARRQLRGWFRLDDACIDWFDVSSSSAIGPIRDFLTSRGLRRLDSCA